MVEYYWLLRSILRAKPQLRACLTRCRHCRIFFLTHPRNAGRHDLRCPFGCREAHRKQQSTRRSVAYYRDPYGKTKKRALNCKRRVPRGAEARPKVAHVGGSGPEEGSVPCNPLMVEHVRMAASLIEGRPLSRKQILEMLARVLRQHSIARRRKLDQTVAWLNENPP